MTPFWDSIAPKVFYFNAEPDFDFDADPDPASNMMQIHADLDLQHFILSYFLLN
jgi:hypothetical protein